MKRLTDDNPYEVLGLGRDAGEREIRLATFGRQARRRSDAAKDKRQLRRAYDLLRTAEQRLIVDALTPDFDDDCDADRLMERFLEGQEGPHDWIGELDESAIREQDFRALVLGTIQHTLGELEAPKGEPAPLSEFDGLTEFIEDYLG